MPLTVSDSERSELLATYAALILHDDKAPITADNIQKLITAAGAEIEPYYPKLFGMFPYPMCKHNQQYIDTVHDNTVEP